MENNPFNEANEEMNPGKQALEKLAEASREEMPEKWLDKSDATGNDVSEKNPSSADTKPDSIFLYFKEINPLGLTLADLKEELLEHIDHLKESIHDTAINESLSPNKRFELIKDLENRIQEKRKWVQRIDYFFAHDTLEPYDGSPLIEHKREKIEKIIGRQNHPEQN